MARPCCWLPSFPLHQVKGPIHTHERSTNIPPELVVGPREAAPPLLPLDEVKGVTLPLLWMIPLTP